MLELKVATKIRGKTAGDDWTIRRDVVNIPLGQSLADAWLTVKEQIEDLDADAKIQKHITGTDVPGTGQIEVAGTSGTGTVRFDLAPADTVLLLPHVTYYYDIQVKTTTGKINTPDDGTIIALPQITLTS
jgi:hypothetical protein